MQGDVGPRGPPGPEGVNGQPGLPGPVGPRGENGATGPSGGVGGKGPLGGPGPVGATGPRGSKGDQGLQGVMGPRGPPGRGANEVDPAKVSGEDGGFFSSPTTVMILLIWLAIVTLLIILIIILVATMRRRRRKPQMSSDSAPNRHSKPEFPPGLTPVDNGDWMGTMKEDSEAGYSNDTITIDARKTSKLNKANNNMNDGKTKLSGHDEPDMTSTLRPQPDVTTSAQPPVSPISPKSPDDGTNFAFENEIGVTSDTITRTYDNQGNLSQESLTPE